MQVCYSKTIKAVCDAAEYRAKLADTAIASRRLSLKRELAKANAERLQLQLRSES